MKSLIALLGLFFSLNSTHAAKFADGNLIERIAEHNVSGGNVTLSVGDEKIHRFFGSGSLRILTLPNATTLREGTSFLVVNDVTDSNIQVNLNDATGLQLLKPGEFATFTLYDNGTTNGLWLKQAPIANAKLNGLGIQTVAGDTSPALEIDQLGSGRGIDVSSTSGTTLFVTQTSDTSNPAISVTTGGISGLNITSTQNGSPAGELAARFTAQGSAGVGQDVIIVESSQTGAATSGESNAITILQGANVGSTSSHTINGILFGNVGSTGAVTRGISLGTGYSTAFRSRGGSFDFFEYSPTIQTTRTNSGAGDDIVVKAADGVGTNQDGGDIKLQKGAETGTGETGAVIIGAPAAEPSAAKLDNGSLSFWLDEGSNEVELIAKKSSGATFSQTIGSGGGGSGSGLRNFIANPGAEVDTTGWVRYNDGAVSDPVDGVGGSPTHSFTRNLSSPLVDTADFNMVADTGDLGEGVAFDFTIDEAFTYQQLNISFSFNTSDPDYASGDLGVYVYDVTNSTLIRPSQISLPFTSGVPQIFNASFQATGSVSYRFILHIASDPSATWNMQLDDFQVGPNRVVVATNASDWVPFPMVIGAVSSAPSKGTIVRDEARWRRVGDSMEIQYSFEQGAGGSSGTGTYLFDLPSGYTIDTTKIEVPSPADNGLAVVGTASLKTSSNPFTGHVYVNDNNSLSLYVVDDLAEGTVSSTFGGLGNANARYSFTALVPIVGWASNFAFSEDGPNVVARYKISGATANPSLAASSDEIIDFNVKDIDSHNAVTTGASWVFTAPIDGKYSVHAIATIINENVVADDFFAIKLFKNGSLFTHLAIDTMDATAVKSSAVAGSTIVSLNAGDTIDIRGIKNMAGSTPLDTDGTLCNVSIERIGSIISIDGNRQNRFQTKILSADVTSDVTVSDLTFNNLRLGKTYEVVLQARLEVNNGAVNNLATVNIRHDGATLGVASFRIDEASATTGSVLISTSSFRFVATATSLTFVGSSLAANSYLAGDGTRTETFAQLTEMNDTYQTTEF